MTIHRIEQTIIPQTEEGRGFADEYEQRLLGQGCFIGREEGTELITLTADFYFELMPESCVEEKE